MDQYKFPCQPVANPESIVLGPQYRFTLLDDKVLRYEWSEDGVFEDLASTFAINRRFDKPEFRVEDTKNQLDIFTPRFHLTYDKRRFSTNGLSVDLSSKQTERGVEWRYGREAEDNLGGTARTVDMVDGRCDMGTGIISSAGYSVLDDSESMLFDGDGFVERRRPGDRIDGYLFAYGYDFKDVMKSFYAISGSQPPVPRWCLGNWWSRFYPYTENEYLALMNKFKDREIPLSVAVIDMDWHYVKGDNVPHVGWTGYTWNKDLFPDPKRFTKALHDRKLKVTLNDHPHAGVHCHEDIYEAMASALGHDTTHKAPILFDPTSQKYMHAYLNVLYRNLEEQGEDFRWIDWQQGTATRVPGFDALWLLNHFHYLDTVLSQSESQALIFSRYAGPGSHRYPVSPSLARYSPRSCVSDADMFFLFCVR
jgi:alpha-glucosidase (family GH31 glycosyl hydrolase)